MPSILPFFGTRMSTASSGFITTNLVLHYDIGNSASYPGTGTTVTDLTGRGNNGTINNGTYNSGNQGYISFNGSSTTITTGQLSDLIFGTGDFSVSYWAYVTTFASSVGQKTPMLDLRNHYSNAGQTSAPYDEFYGGTRPNNNDYRLWFESTSNLKIATYSSPSSAHLPGVWFNNCYTRTGSTGAYYINGVKYGDLSWSENSSVGTFRFGTSESGAGNYLNGRFAQCAIYKGKGLTQSEVTQNYNILKTRYGL